MPLPEPEIVVESLQLGALLLVSWFMWRVGVRMDRLRDRINVVDAEVHLIGKTTAATAVQVTVIARAVVPPGAFYGAGSSDRRVHPRTGTPMDNRTTVFTAEQIAEMVPNAERSDAHPPGDVQDWPDQPDQPEPFSQVGWRPPR
jgi:hypothetical protein